MQKTSWLNNLDLTSWAQTALHFPGEIKIYSHRTLERSANGKLELFKSLID